MKLPQEKSERIKLYALFGVGAAFVLYLGGMYAIRPLQNVKQERREKIAARRADLSKARTVIKLVSRSRLMNADIVREIMSLTERNRYVLRARLGNYLLGASELLEEQAAAAGIELKSVTEVGISDPPVGADQVPSSAFRIYTARVETQCGLHALRELIHGIETSNPLVAIAALTVNSNPAQAAIHDVRFDVQWPIWRNPEHPDKIRASVRLLEGGA